MSSNEPGATWHARNGAVDIAYQDLGGAGGDPLLLVMGLGVSRFWWPEGLIDELISRGFHVAAFDQRDAGESTRLPDTGPGSPIVSVLRGRSAAYTAEDMTDDAVAVLDALGWDSAHLLGASMGGQLAQRIALRHPGRVRSITSASSLPGDISGLRASRYVHLGQVARFARMKFPEGRDGDIAWASRSLAPWPRRGTPSTRRRPGRGSSAMPSAAFATPARRAVRPARNGTAARWRS